MIVRPQGNDWLLFPQREHARISAELAVAMPLPPFDTIGERDTLLAAIEMHDDGWQDWDARAPIDPELGRPLGFNEMARADALPIWSKSIQAAARLGPLPAFTVTSHFLRLAALGDQDPFTTEWRSEFEAYYEAWRTEWLRDRPNADPQWTETAVQWLRFFDSFSLNLCRGQDIEPFGMKRPDGTFVELDWLTTDRIACSPWLFTCGNLEVSLPARLFRHDAIQTNEVRLTWYLAK